MKTEDIIKELKIPGQVVAIKTDTVYGLICNPHDKEACSKIYEIKKREAKKPLAIFVKNVEEVKKYVDNAVLTKKLLSIMNKYWPGSLTIILKKKEDVFSNITCGQDTIGVRIPADTQLIDILQRLDFPLAETSCNISGEPEYTTAIEIREKFGTKVDLIVDGGAVTENIPSTVIEVIDDKIKVLRQGAVLIDE